MNQVVMWTALPRGAAEDRLRLAVFVSPKLDPGAGGGTLSLFPDFVNWPDVLNTLRFEVEIQGGHTFTAERVSNDADAKLWSDLFPADTTVKPFVFNDFSTRHLLSYPIGGVVDFITTLYTDLAQHASEDLPNLDDPRGPNLANLLDIGAAFSSDRVDKELAHLEFTHEGRDRRNQETPVELKTFDPSADPSDFGFPNQAALDLYRANRFYNRPETKEPSYGPKPPPPAALTPPELGFHEAVSALSDYPALLRRLGLVVDLDFPADVEATGALRVRSSLDGENYRPWTAYEYDRGSWFGPQPLPDSDLERGWIKLQDASDPLTARRRRDLLERKGKDNERRFDIVQVDPDGAALKLVHTAVNLDGLASKITHNEASFDTPDNAGVPSIRTAGLAIVRRDRAIDVAQRLAESAVDAGRPDESVTLYADHLIRGYRIDVYDRSSRVGAWRSLCHRIGDYTIRPDGAPEVPIGQIADEGYVKAGSTTSKDDSSSPLYLHETLTKWDGWSLVAKRPGRTIRRVDNNGIHEEKVDVPDTELATEFKLDTRFTARPGTLPRLRFGRTYMLRARWVDLAGHSLDAGDGERAYGSEPVFYVRYEPVAPPVVVPKERFGEGESVERMTIRSDFDKEARDYVADPQVEAALENSEHRYREHNDRHLLPPKTSQLMAETHGVFDVSIGEGASHQEAYDVGLRESATLEFTHELDADLELHEFPVLGTAKIPGKAPRSGPLPDEREAPGSYIVNTLPMFKAPYLPDPSAAGVALRGLPGMGDEIWTRDFEGKWPDLKTLVIRAAERRGVLDHNLYQETYSEDPELDWVTSDEERVLTVPLGKGDVIRVRYSTYLDEAHLRLMGVWQKLIEEDPSLSDDEKEALFERALLGQHWMISPHRELVLVHAVQRPLFPPDVLWLAPSRDTGDTFARFRGEIGLNSKTTGQVDLVARWEDPVDVPTDKAWKIIGGRAHVATRSVPLEVGDGTTVFPFMTDDSYEELRHEFGDTKHRIVTYQMIGTTRFREYFPPEITADEKNISRRGAEVTVPIPSSARPEAPRVRYSVPTFEWTGSGREPFGSGSFRRTRRGGALRVWMDRPWFTSGRDELLGVVLWTGKSEPPEAFANVVSRLGTDPIWDSETRSHRLKGNDFNDARHPRTGITLAERDGGTLEVVGFDPHFDFDRKLWFADVDLSRKVWSYTPFFRPAFVRYQPNSIGKHVMVSAVVLDDYIQLLPDRHLELTYDGGGIDVSLWGLAPEGPYANHVEASLERHSGEVPGDLGWEEIPDSARRLSDGSEAEWFDLLRLRDYIQKRHQVGPWSQELLSRRLETITSRLGGEIPRGVTRPGPTTGKTSRPDATSGVELPVAPSISGKNAPFLTPEHAEMYELDEPLVGGLKFPTILIPGSQTWTGKIALPSDDLPLRLVVREYEHFRSDRETAEEDKDGQEPRSSRVVYADVVRLQ